MSTALRRSTAGAALLAVLLLVPASPSMGAGAPRVTKIDPGAAVTGAAVTVRGRNLSGRGTKVTVAGKNAKVLSAKRAVLTFVVPNVKVGTRKVVVKRGRESSARNLRVLKRFAGRVTATVDTKRAVKGTIGPGGGSITAKSSDGVTYVLAIPPGALTASQSISVVPVKSFGGLPLTGDEVAGARLLPDGLKLAKPATLTITGAGRFDATTVGFSQGSGTGFDLSEPISKPGSTLIIEVDHFSEHGGASAAAADFANLVQPLIRGLGNMSLSQIRTLVALLAIWDHRFSPRTSIDRKPPSFCGAQPICTQALEKALRSVNVLAQDACARGRRNPALGTIRELIDLEANRGLLGGRGNVTNECIDDIGTKLTDTVLAALTTDPLGHFTDADLLPAGFTADITGDGTITAFEFAFALAPEVARLGVPNADARLTNALGGALDKIRTDGLARCGSDRAEGARRLREGFAYANTLSRLTSEFLDALDGCGVGVVVVPQQIELAPGQEFQFKAELTNEAARGEGRGVAWSASAGSISLNGLFTAPAASGDYTVRATSKVNPERFATSKVTVVDESCGTGSASPGRRQKLSLAAAGDPDPVVHDGDVRISAPDDIQAFRDAGITEVNGNLLIGPATAGDTSTVTDLAGMTNLTKVTGFVSIGLNPSLKTLRGLDGVTSVGGLSISSNDGLENVDGLCGLATTGSLGIGLNPVLTSVAGLSSLTTVGSGFAVTGNAALTNLNGLGALTVVGELFNVNGPALTSVSGLTSLVSIGDDLAIRTEALPAMTTFALPALETVGAELRILGPGGPLATADFPQLRNIGTDFDRVTIRDTGLQTLRAPSLVKLDGSLELNGLGKNLVVDFGTAAVTDNLLINGNTAGTSLTITVGSVRQAVVIGNVSLSPLIAKITRIEERLRFGGCAFGPFPNVGNRATFPTQSQIGSVGESVEIHGNVGFTDQQAMAFASTISAGEPPSVVGNVASGEPTC